MRDLHTAVGGVRGHGRDAVAEVLVEARHGVAGVPGHERHVAGLVLAAGVDAGLQRLHDPVLGEVPGFDAAAQRHVLFNVDVRARGQLDCAQHMRTLVIVIHHEVLKD